MLQYLNLVGALFPSIVFVYKKIIVEAYFYVCAANENNDEKCC